MRQTIDDMKLTAYALGELEAGERAAVEAHLAGHPAALAHVEEVRATARLLTDALAEEPGPALTGPQLVAIERRVQGAGTEAATATRAAPRRRNWGLWASVAASTLIVCTVMASVLPRLLPVGSGNGRGGATSGSTPDGSRGPLIFTPPAGQPAPEAEDAGPPGGGVTVVEVEVPQRASVNGPTTRAYQPLAREKQYLEQTPEPERTNGDVLHGHARYDLNARRGSRVAWFGIVREVRKVRVGEAGRPDAYELLLQHKYFDGSTDPHTLAMSMDGGGDFKARVWTRDRELPIRPRMLVRVYGNVLPAEPAGIAPVSQPATRASDLPLLEAEYARVFRQRLGEGPAPAGVP